MCASNQTSSQAFSFLEGDYLESVKLSLILEEPKLPVWIITIGIKTLNLEMVEGTRVSKLTKLMIAIKHELAARAPTNVFGHLA